jgi:hypothetical protein
MSNYTQSTNFATKDALTSGDPLKIVKGTEINTEFVNISTAIATKADLASPAFTGTPTAPTASSGNNSTQLATTAYTDAAVSAIATSIKSALFPVGAIYTAVVSTNPATLLGFGTWTAFGAGRVLVGFDSSNALFDTVEETGGSANAITVSHTHTATSTVTDSGHNHSVIVAPLSGVNGYVNPSSPQEGYPGATTGTTGSATTGITVATTNSSTGSSGTNANYQPYITVYMWKRTV